MLYFKSDYTEGAHPKVLQRLVDDNMVSMPGYCADETTISAKAKIRKFCNKEDAQVWLLTGGTQTNQIVISTMLRQHQSVVAAESGHINVHESGAIEFVGHKVETVPQHDGKICAKELDAFLKDYFDGTLIFCPIPGMVYISHPTEYGTLYSKEELKNISDVCHKYDIPLYLDGARLGYGLMSRHTDVTIDDIVELTDAFYIGGTKIGALCGEAIVFTKNNMPAYFDVMCKQHGAMLAKGRLLGMQFDTLFTDNLYLEISRHAIDMAEYLKEIFVEKGYTMHVDSPTNQQFVVLDNKKAEELKQNVAMEFWERVDEERSVYRFVTSWSTKKENIDKLKELL